MAILEVQNVCKRFQQNEVLKGISFSLEEKSVLAVIGSSGSGSLDAGEQRSLRPATAVDSRFGSRIGEAGWLAGLFHLHLFSRGK